MIFKFISNWFRFQWLRISWNYHHILLNIHVDIARWHYRKEEAILDEINRLNAKVNAMVKDLDAS